MLTKAQFRAQFRFGPVEFANADIPPPIYTDTQYGYKIYRALQLLVLQDEKGDFYVSRLQ